MKKWEYLFVYYATDVEVGVMDTIGENGWELIAVIQSKKYEDSRWIFKRQKIESVKPVNDD